MAFKFILFIEFEIKKCVWTCGSKYSCYCHFRGISLYLICVNFCDFSTFSFINIFLRNLKKCLWFLYYVKMVSLRLLKKTKDLIDHYVKEILFCDITYCLILFFKIQFALEERLTSYTKILFKRLIFFYLCK